MKWSKMNYRNAPGPGDLWGSPPDDPPECDGTCDCCGENFTYDPNDFMDADEDGVYCCDPTMCERCRNHDCDDMSDKPCQVKADCSECGDPCPEPPEGKEAVCASCQAEIEAEKAGEITYAGS